MAAPEDREVTEGLQYQGEDEIIIYTVDITNVGDDPTGVAVKVYSVYGETYTDVTSTVMPVNSPSVLANIITLSPLKLLTLGISYQVEVKFDIATNTFEHYFRVLCQK